MLLNRSATGLLQLFHRGGVLDTAEVHVAAALARICGEQDPRVLLAAALAVRAPRLSAVCVDLSAAAGTISADEDAAATPDPLRWPELEAWRDAVATSPCVGDGRPLRLDGCRVYLDRYWQAEQLVARSLLSRAAAAAPPVDEPALARQLSALADPDQRNAVATAVRNRLAVIAGGPGTGKTTTIKKVLEVLADQSTLLAAGPPQVALVAPTGKAAQRVTESVADDGLKASTIHKLLHRRPDAPTRFRHDASDPLPHDVVVVDEASMVSLDLMAKLLAAVRPEARLLLVGDPDQLRSVEAGAVFGDVVAPASEQPPAPGPLPGVVAVLRRVHRFGGESGIAALAAAIRGGEPDAVLELLSGDRPDVRWLPVDVGEEHGLEEALRTARVSVTAAQRAVFDAARRGDGAAALEALTELRVLCAHRRGRYGVARWNERIERWLTADVPGFDPSQPWHIGRPVLVPRNDYQLGLFNGDTGVAVAQPDGRLAVAFAAGKAVRLVAPHRLDGVDTVHAMTVHKSQGSQLQEVIVVLPDPGSKVLTRELLYTAATRARARVTIVGTPASVTEAVLRQVRRPSGLRERLRS